MVNQTDYHGRLIPSNEPLDKRIIVWTVEPSTDSSYDITIIRSYQQAISYAQSVVESLMDDPDQDFPVVIKIGQMKMTVGDLEEGRGMHI